MTDTSEQNFSGDVQRKKRTTVTLSTLRAVRRHMEKNLSPKTIACEEELSLSAIYSLHKKIADGKTDEEILMTTKGRPKSEHAMIKQEIATLLLQDNSFNQKEIADELERKNILISQPTISRMLKNMNYTRKRLVKVSAERNSPVNINIRQEFARNIEFICDSNFVFLDETGCNLHITRNYGYSPVNTKAYKVVKGNRGQNISCMVAIKNSGVIAYKIKDGAFNGESFLEFINAYLINHFLANPSDILVMDNCRFHHKREVVGFLRNSGIRHMFLPPYSPQLNPIEEYFSFLKSKLAGNHTHLNNRNDLKVKIEQILNEQNVSFDGWFRNMRRYVALALARQAFI